MDTPVKQGKSTLLNILLSILSAAALSYNQKIQRIAELVVL